MGHSPQREQDLPETRPIGCQGPNLDSRSGDAERDPGSTSSEFNKQTRQPTPLRPPNFDLTPENEPRKPKLVNLIPGLANNIELPGVKVGQYGMSCNG
jgi:hypothetical protein